MNDEIESHILGQVTPRGADRELREQTLRRVRDELTRQNDSPATPPVRQSTRTRRPLSAGAISAAVLLLGIVTCVWVDRTARQRLDAAFGSTVATRQIITYNAPTMATKSPTATRGSPTSSDSFGTAITLIHATYRQYLFENREEPVRSRRDVPHTKSSQMDGRGARGISIHAVAGKRLVCVERESTA
ncbi:MAG: hypothetical protein U1A77_22535 [Pirellulales bacterium]